MTHTNLDSLIRQLITIQRLHGDLLVVNWDGDVLDIEPRDDDGNSLDIGDAEVTKLRFY